MDCASPITKIKANVPSATSLRSTQQLEDATLSQPRTNARSTVELISERESITATLARRAMLTLSSTEPVTRSDVSRTPPQSQTASSRRNSGPETVSLVEEEPLLLIEPVASLGPRSDSQSLTV